MRRRPRTHWRVAPVVTALIVASSCGTDSAGDAATTASSTPASSTTPATTPTIDVDTELEQEPEPVTDQTTPSVPTPSTPPASAPAATAATSEAVDADCRRLTDFDGDEATQWFVVNDGVMGGRSNGAIEVTDSVMRFTGGVVTAGGGFTSVRFRLDGTELAGATRVELRVRADQRTYGLTLEDDAQVRQRAVSHRADLTIDEADDNDGWTTAELSFADLQPSLFGQPVDAPPFNPDTAREIGIIIADSLDGDFTLEVDWIDACR